MLDRKVAHNDYPSVEKLRKNTRRKRIQTQTQPASRNDQQPEIEKNINLISWPSVSTVNSFSKSVPALDPKLINSRNKVGNDYRCKQSTPHQRKESTHHNAYPSVNGTSNLRLTPFSPQAMNPEN